MVLQRQVPARPVAKAGEGFTGADAAGDGRSDAFSAALSQEKRSAVAESQDKRSVAAQSGKVASDEETDAGTETGEPDDQLDSGPGQSDEVLNLLSGLMSSAAYSDDAGLGKAAQAEPLSPEIAASADPETAPAADGAEADGAEDVPAGKPDASALIRPAMAGSDDVNEARTRTAGARVATPRAQPETAAATESLPTADAAKASAAQPGQYAPADARSAAAAPAGLLSAAAAAMSGQATQAPAKASATEPGPERQKDQTAIKEVMRALGMEGEAQTADDARVRGRNASRQGGAAERNSDEPATLKGGKVEVIESRRFMPAQAMSANAQLLTRSLVDAGNTALSAQRTAPAQPLAQTGPQQAGQTLHTLKLQLNPVSLGTVTAVLKLSGEELSVEIKVQTAEAFRQIKQDNESIIKALRGQGFGVEQITVQHVAGPDRASSQTAQQGFQPSQQGPGSSDAQSSGSESGRNNAGNQGAGSQGGQGHEQSSYAGSGVGRTDGVYL